jgi:hypothetical protein
MTLWKVQIRVSTIRYLVAIQPFEIIVSKVRWIPVPCFSGYIRPKETPRYDGSKKCRAVNYM